MHQRQIETGFVSLGTFMETIDNLTPNVEYTVRVITTSPVCQSMARRVPR